MKTPTSTVKAIFVTSLVLLFGIGTSVHASSFREVAYEFDSYTFGNLDWAESADDTSTGPNSLGFSVTIGGATYSYFDMSSNGYIELLTDACDVPTDHGWGDVNGLITADPCATYLLAAYDDLSSLVYGYHGYLLLSDPNRAVFYYETETYEDTGVSLDQLNLFEVILYEDGNVQWNFNYAEYSFSLLDLFSGLYFGNTQTLLELDRYHIPEQESYLYYGCDDWLTTDFNNDCFTDWADFGIFALQWFKCTELNNINCWLYTLTINTVGSGSVTKTPDQATFTYGTIVDVNAIADPGWTFDSWSGDLTGSTNPNSITMDGSKTITATFTEDQYVLTINTVGNGSVTKDPNQATYTYGTIVDVNAIADANWTFSAWSGDLSGSNNPDTITMDANKTVTATFTEDQNHATLTINTIGSGSVTKTPDQATFTYDTIVDVNAIADPGWTFDSWSGDLTGSTNPNSITMDVNKTVTATFTEDQYTLSINTVGNGSVTKDPNQATYTYGTFVDVNAIADANWAFSAWSGDLSGSNNPETITIDSNETITATFTQEQYTLTINVVGAGTVTKTPDQETYLSGTIVDVNAIGDGPWTFDSWSGDLLGSINPETITMDEDKIVTATFTM